MNELLTYLFVICIICIICIEISRFLYVYVDYIIIVDFSFFS